MRIIALILVVSSILLFSIPSSFAQTSTTTHRPVIGIYVQIIIHDAAGNLISYIESSRALVIKPHELPQYIDENIGQFQSTIIHLVTGQNYEMLKVTSSSILNSSTVIAQNIIAQKTSNGNQPLAYLNHDGFPVAPGDNMTTYWTIIRPAP